MVFIWVLKNPIVWKGRGYGTKNVSKARTDGFSRTNARRLAKIQPSRQCRRSDQMAHVRGDHQSRIHRSVRSCACVGAGAALDRKSTRLNSSHQIISYAVFCLKKKKKNQSN